MADYTLYREGSALIVRRTAFPRFSARVDWYNRETVLRDFQRDDAVMITDAQELADFWARIFRETGDYLAGCAECPRDALPLVCGAVIAPNK